MANLIHRMKTTLYAAFENGKSQKRKDDPNHVSIHSYNTLTIYLREARAFAVWLKAQGVKSRCSDEEAAGYVQDYIDDLVAQGKSEASIHTAVAAICKALSGAGIKMSDFEKPRRISAPKKGRVQGQSLKNRSDADIDNPKFERLVKFAKAVGIRREEYENLTGKDFVTIGDYSYVIVRQGKGGKRQLQRIEPEDVPLVRSYFDGLKPDERVFTPEEMKNKLNLHKIRRERAQMLYWKYETRLKEDPAYRVQLLSEVRDAFTLAGEDWRKNPDMQRINKPYHCRGNVRKAMRDESRAVKYDRLALMAVSVFSLAHWRADVTVKNYMQ